MNRRAINFACMRDTLADTPGQAANLQAICDPRVAEGNAGKLPTLESRIKLSRTTALAA